MAPRPNWKGYLKLSLVSCSIALYPATSASERVSFNQLNKNTGNRIRYKKVDAETDEEVESADIVKGYQVERTSTCRSRTKRSRRCRSRAATPSKSTSSFRRSQIDARYFDSPYYIVPNDKVGQDAFAVIRDAMREKKTVEDVA